MKYFEKQTNEQLDVLVLNQQQQHYQLYIVLNLLVNPILMQIKLLLLHQILLQNLRAVLFLLNFHQLCRLPLKLYQIIIITQ